MLTTPRYGEPLAGASGEFRADAREKYGRELCRRSDAGRARAAESGALDDLAHAREQAQQEARSGIDSAVERIREVRKDLGARAHDEAEEMQSRLEHASEEALREFGRAAVRAQRTLEALTEMQTEIRARKRTLLV